MDVRHLGAASWLVLREKLLKAILCPCRRPVQQWEQVVFGEGSSVCVGRGGSVWRTRMPVYAWRLVGVCSDCR